MPCPVAERDVPYGEWLRIFRQLATIHSCESEAVAKVKLRPVQHAATEKAVAGVRGGVRGRVRPVFGVSVNGGGVRGGEVGRRVKILNT